MQLLELVGHNFFILCTYWWREYVKRRARSDPLRTLSQLELNAVYLGPEFVLATRYASAISTFLVCYMYAAGIPILMIIVAINFLLTYWVDKFLFISFYRTPPNHGADISHLATSVLKIGVLAHLLMTLWIFSQQKIFQTDTVTDISIGQFE